MCTRTASLLRVRVDHTGLLPAFLRDSPLAWRSARQPLVTLSTAESEFIEAVEGALLGLADQGLVRELTGQRPMIYIHVDNQAFGIVEDEAFEVAHDLAVRKDSFW